jgi:hypothetical protein
MQAEYKLTMRSHPLNFAESIKIRPRQLADKGVGVRSRSWGKELREPGSGL